jgi:hypothetical protein
MPESKGENATLVFCIAIESTVDKKGQKNP